MTSSSWAPHSPYQTQIEAALAQLEQGSPQTLVFHGPGEIDRTDLGRSLQEQLGESCLWGWIDGADLSQQPVTSWEQVPFRLRRDLNAAHQGLTAFDLACCHYLQQTQLQLPVMATEFADRLGWPDLSSTATVLMEMMLADPRALTFPPTSALAKLGLYVIRSGAMEHWHWYHHSPSRAALHELAKQTCDRQILQCLPELFLQDLGHYQRQEDIPPSHRRAVILVHDADRILADAQGSQWLPLWMDQSSAQVLWILLAEQPIESLPEATPVELSPLTSVVRSPDPDPPVDSDDPEIERVLSLLAYPLVWDRSLLERLMQEFELGSGVERWPQVTTRPEVESLGPDRYRVGLRLRQSYQASLPQGSIWRLHQVLFEHYRDRFAQWGRLEDLEQAVLHGQQGLDPELMVTWLVQQVPGLLDRGLHQGSTLLLADLWQADQVTEQQAWIGLRLGQSLCALQEWDWGLAVLTEVQQVWSQLGADQSLGAAETALALGEIYLTDMRTWEAYRVLRQALQIRIQQVGEGSTAVAEVLSRLTEAAVQQPNLGEALNWSQRALENLQQDPEARTVDIALQLETVGYLYYQLDNLVAAVRTYQQGIEQLDSVAEASGLKILMVAQLAACFEQIHDLKAASFQYQMAIILAQAALEQGHPQTIGLLKAGARFCHQVQAKEQAMALDQQIVIEQWLWNYCEVSPAGSQRLERMGAALIRSGDDRQAEPLLVANLHVRQQLYGEESVEGASGYNQLAVLYQYQERYLEAEQGFQRSLALSEKLLDETDPRLVSTLVNLANLYSLQERIPEALPLYQRTLQILRRSPPHPQHPPAEIIEGYLQRFQELGFPALIEG